MHGILRLPGCFSLLFRVLVRAEYLGHGYCSPVGPRVRLVELSENRALLPARKFIARRRYLAEVRLGFLQKFFRFFESATLV